MDYEVTVLDRRANALIMVAKVNETGVKAILEHFTDMTYSERSAFLAALAESNSRYYISKVSDAKQYDMKIKKVH